MKYLYKHARSSLKYLKAICRPEILELNKFWETDLAEKCCGYEMCVIYRSHHFLSICLDGGLVKARSPVIYHVLKIILRIP